MSHAEKQIVLAMITVKAPVTLPRAGERPLFRDKVGVVGGGGKEEDVKIVIANYDLIVIEIRPGRN